MWKLHCCVKLSRYTVYYQSLTMLPLKSKPRERQQQWQSTGFLVLKIKQLRRPIWKQKQIFQLLELKSASQEFIIQQLEQQSGSVTLCTEDWNKKQLL